jgi:cob(I)alamin adenosyltransferase
VAGIAERWSKTNVVVTGRDAPAELIEIADTVTEMAVVKHAYQRGVTAIKGIEY